MVKRERTDGQLELFGGGEGEEARGAGRKRTSAVAAAEVPDEVSELGKRMPDGVHLGGSTWSFPGWEGLVYGGAYSPSRLARDGLAAYARHPLLRAVGIDRTHYRPMPAEELARLGAEVPESFRFLVKAHEACTLARYPDRPRYGAERGLANPRFLDAAYAADAVVGPYVEGLGRRGGALLFQFAPQQVGSPQRFAAELGRFLCALPRGPIYAVELRNRELLIPDYAAALASAGACHCLNVHPRMPDIRFQARAAGAGNAPLTAIRWLLGGGITYEEAGRRYTPFNRLAAPDPAARAAVAETLHATLASGRPFLCTVNNNAEGCAPLSILALARQLWGEPVRGSGCPEGPHP